MASNTDELVPHLLARLERWLAQHRPNYLRRLPPGATDTELNDLERTLRIPLPKGLRSLLAWHNGQGNEFIGAFQEDWLLLSCQSITAAKADLEQNPEIEWKPAWIPFLDNDAGDYAFVDAGHGGDAVRIHELEQKEPSKIAPTLTDWLREFVENVERGNYVEDPERGRFTRRHMI